MVDPQTVTSPKARWKLVCLLYNEGKGGYSVALGLWDDEPALGLRYNGDEDPSDKGSPIVRGKPAWFIVKGSELQKHIFKALLKVAEVNQNCLGKAKSLL
ncbi:hypothetical protein [Thermus caliditerrae]|uniref:hypothetical protein n=1 Tax=Thermus caliditerrae TaxID=1330700 RepID=UPI001F3B3CFC|nr:hypothetical protein [Thermus caliditerrae]